MICKETLIQTNSLEKTRALGQKIGSLLHGDFRIALIGDLGSGKTAFIQGLAAGLDVPERYRVTSPSYTIINEYPGRLKLYHIDLYRIEAVDELEETGLFEVLEASGIIAVEWAERLPRDFSGEYLQLYFSIVDDERRKIRVKGYGQEGVRLVNVVEQFLLTDQT